MADQTQSVRSERLPIGEHGALLGLITFNRPEEMNPIDHEAIGEMRAAIDDFCRDAAVRVLAITGRGKAFSAGGDMKKYMTLQRDPVAFPLFLDDLAHDGRGHDGRPQAHHRLDQRHHGRRRS
jgi:enoyl-CoA hydratase/carnithine racemase